MPEPTSVSGYADLGVPPLINAAGRYTKFGGSVMPPQVVAAMAEASRTHVDLEHLQRAVGDRIAALTRNEAAFVTVGAAAGIILAVLASATGDDEVAVRRMLEGRHRTGQVIVQRAHAIPYLPAIRLAGMEPVEIGNAFNTEPEDLAAAITEDTVAVLHIAGDHLTRGSLPLPQLIKIAGEHDLPVIVDAAAQLPPVENLWQFTEQGAALALFSGGKDLCGPQASGLIVGQRRMIEAIRRHSAPRQRLARALKTGKEEMMGLLAAVELYVAMDHEARRAQWHTTLDRWRAELAAEAPEITVRLDEMNEAGQPIPRLLVSWEGGPTAGELIAALLAGSPALAVAGGAGERTVGLTPETLLDAEIGQVVPTLLAGQRKLAS